MSDLTPQEARAFLTETAMPYMERATRLIRLYRTEHASRRVAPCLGATRCLACRQADDLVQVQERPRVTARDQRLLADPIVDPLE